LRPEPKLRSQRDINLWRIPLQCSLVAVALLGITQIPDILDKYGVIHIPSWLTMGSIDDARAIPSAMMGAVATVLALIFSVALLVLSMVSTLFGPRLLYRFLQDWVTQVTIGMFMGTFVYICLVFLVTHQDPRSSFIPQISLITAWMLVVLSFGFLIYYSHRVAKSIQNPDMIAAIVDDLYVAAGGAHVPGPGEGTGAVPDDAEILRQAETGATVSCAKSGYLQHVDHGALVAAPRSADALIALRFRPGQFVLRGEPLAAIVPAETSATLKARLIEEFTSAITALSPKIASSASRRLLRSRSARCLPQSTIRSPALRAWTGSGMRCSHWPNGPRSKETGTTLRRLRVWMPPVRLERLAKLAFDQIRQASSTTPAVLIRQLEAIRRLAPRLPDACRQALSDEADGILETASALVALDRRDLDAAWRRAHTALETLPR
jgi:uncharacterized membrane protein